jgi:Uma2 family endonuclease
VQPASTADLLRLPNRHEYDLVDGELRKLVVHSPKHDDVVSRIVQRLYDWNDDFSFGVVVVGTGFCLAAEPDTVLTADVALISKGQIESHGISESFFPESPTFVVDVVAPNDSAEDLNDRMIRWSSAGVKLAWSVFPANRSVTVYRGINNICRKSGKDLLVGHEILPEFTCPVEDLF